MPHHTIAHARGTAGRGLSPGSPESRVRNYEELYEYIQRLSRLNVTRRYPRSFHSPTVAQLKVSFSRLINLQMMQVNASSATRLAVNAALERLPNTIYESAIDFMNEHPQHMQLLLWYLFQRGYVSRVVQEIIRGFLEALPGIIRQRNSRQLQKRGEFFIRAHLALAANSTLFPFIFLFLAGAIKKIIADTYQLIRQLYRYNVEPEGITLDLLKALTPLLELTFAEEENGLGRGHRLGRNLADGFASEIEDVIFPNPVGDDGPIVYGVVGVEILRRFDENSIVRKLASLLMAPWSMGAFIGPLLIDIILTIIGLVFPELGLLALLRNVSGLRRIMELVNGVMDAASRALKTQRRFQRSVRDFTPDITPGDASPRARGISGTGGESQAARVGAGSAAESQEVQSRQRRRRGREHHEQMELGQERPTRQEARARREAASQAGEANRVVRDRETGQTQRATSSARLQTEAPSSQRQQSRQATRQRLQETPEEQPPATQSQPESSTGGREMLQPETEAQPTQARQAAQQTRGTRREQQRPPDTGPRDPRGTGDPGNQRPETSPPQTQRDEPVLELHALQRPQGDYVYGSDNLGRPTSAEGWVDARSAPRSPQAQTEATEGLSGEWHGSHLIPRRNGGAPDRRNLVPARPRINQSIMTTLENEINRRLAVGERLYMKTTVTYRGTGKVPHSIRYRLFRQEADGSLSRVFDTDINPAGQLSVPMGSVIRGREFYQPGSRGTEGGVQ